jgi:hypothetical protein
MAKKKKIDLDTKLRFNDIVMRELHLDLTEDDYLYDMTDMSIFQIKEKFIKYFDYEFPNPRHNEIEMNLIENPSLTETIALPFFTRYCERNNYIFHSIAHVPVKELGKTYFVLSYICEGKIKNEKSDNFVNESVSIFNLITKLNKTSHMYKFDDFDIKIIRKK